MTNKAADEVFTEEKLNITDDVHEFGESKLQMRKPLFKKVPPGENLNLQDDIESRQPPKEKRNRLSRRSFNTSMSSQGTVKTEADGADKKYCLRKHTPTKREIETKNRTSRAIAKPDQSKGNKNEEPSDHVHNKSDKDELLGKTKATEESVDDVNNSGKIKHCDFYCNQSVICIRFTGPRNYNQRRMHYVVRRSLFIIFRDQRWISGNIHYVRLHKKANKAEPTLALKPKGDITRNPKQGYQWPQKWTCVRQKL